MRLKTVVNRQRAIEREAARIVNATGDLKPWDDWAQTLHEEIDRLPRCFRLPIVLCDLEGHSYDAAAMYLDCPTGTIKSRLARGRSRLRDRLSRRGITPATESSESPVPALLGTATVSTSLAKATIQGLIRAKPLAAQTGGVFSISVMTLAERVLRTMLLTKIRATAVTVLAACTVFTGLGLLATVASAPSAPSAQGAGDPTAVTKIESPVPPAEEISTPESPSDPSGKSKSGPFNAPEPVITLGDPKRIWAYDPDKKSWHTYKAPDGVNISSIIAQSHRLVALRMEGDPIEEIAVFSAKLGKWSRQALAEPASSTKVEPLLQNNYALYVIDQQVYAFSALTGKWSPQMIEKQRRSLNINTNFHSLAILQDDKSVHAYQRHYRNLADDEDRRDKRWVSSGRPRRHRAGSQWWSSLFLRPESRPIRGSES